MTCCLLLDLYPLQEGLARYIKSRRKLGLTLTGLVPLNASGSLYQLEKGLRNRSRSCLLSSAIRLLLPCTETPNTVIFSSVYIQDCFLYPHTRLHLSIHLSWPGCSATVSPCTAQVHVRVGYRPQGTVCTFIPNDLVY